MKTEKQLKKSAAFLYLFNLIFVLVSVLILEIGFSKMIENNLNLDMETMLDHILWYVVAYCVIVLISDVLALINFIQFCKLWKYYGPRFWRCLFVILYILGFLFYIASLVLWFGFGINIYLWY